jgi:hypothetical protein
MEEVMKKFIIILFIILISTDIFAQAPDTMWTKTFGNSGVIDRGRSVQQTNDGGYIITGITEFRGNNNEDVWLIKTNTIGDTMWTRIFGGSLPDGGSSVLQTADGGYIITGYTFSFGSGSVDLWLIKTNAHGDTMWTKTFGGSRDDRGNSVDTTLDGGYIIAGKTIRSDPGFTKAWLIKTDSDGDTLWTKTFGDSSSLEGTSVQHTNDGGYIIVGSNRTVVGGKQKKQNSDIMLESTQNSNDCILLIKTDSYGNTLWTKTINGINRSWANSIRQTSDGGYILTGITNFHYHWPPGYNAGDMWLIKTDIHGNKLWMKNYGDSLMWEEGYSVQQTTDGGYIVAGTNLIKTNTNGDILWTKAYEGNSVQQTNDYGYIIVGTRYDPGFDVMLIKIAPDLTSIIDNPKTTLNDYHLEQNYPNPFNPSTTIEFSVPKPEKLKIEIYNLLGQNIETLLNKPIPAGSHEVEFNARDLPSGVYLYRIEAGEFQQVKKMVLLR